MLTYQILLEHDGDNYAVSFPDHPDVLTYGSTREDALEQAQDALLTEFIICAAQHRAFAMPSCAVAADVVTLPIMPSLKIFLHNAMVEKGYHKADLARLLGWNNIQIARALDPRHQSRVSLIEDALHRLGKGVAGRSVSL